ncbi:unnamed protein product, partial [Onchocerca ochengi]|uniref:Uncharacterized protein n=1 Tax=Onchocerca ochengi TaxID=42157 RepID=A0A182EU54_ONCOC
MCAEIPDADVDKDLHKVATKNMIHGVCSKAVIPKEQALANERTKERMAKMGTERHSARLEDARLRARRSCSVASDLLCSEQNQSRDYNRLALQYDSADDYNLSPHVLSDTMNE